MKEYRFERAEYAVYSAVVMIAGVFIGLVMVAPFLPPWDQAGASAQTIAEFYQEDNLGKRIGLCLMMFGIPFAVPFFTLIGEIIRRPMNMPILGMVEIGTGWFGILFTFMMTVCWGTAAFRPDRSAEITQALHDLGWLFATWVGSATLMQAICIACAVFLDKSKNPVFPRWFGYLVVWAFILGIPACVINVFNTGPFAYDGLLGFWIPYLALGAWAGFALVVCYRAVRQLQSDEPGYDWVKGPMVSGLT